jgi:hypothetical protein
VSYLDNLRNDQAAAKAAAVNCSIELPARDELQIDLDDAFTGMSAFETQYKLLVDLKLIPEAGFMVRYSRNGNKHVTIRLGEDITPERRIVLQALLGSDLKREALSLKRVDMGEPHPTLLFRPLQ